MTSQKTSGPFHKSSYERFLLYEFVESVLNYGSNEFVALVNICETGLIHQKLNCYLVTIGLGGNSVHPIK